MSKPSTRRPGETRGRKALENVELTTQHSINGQRFGPGTVRVTRDVAAVLREQETRFNRAEASLYEQGASLIGTGNRIIRVRPDFFDTALGAVEPMARVSNSEGKR